jgi:hypothetical protein
MFSVFSFGFAEARTQFSVQSFGFKPVLAATKRPSLVGSHSHSAFMPMFSCLRKHPGYPRSLASGSQLQIHPHQQGQCNLKPTGRAIFFEWSFFDIKASVVAHHLEEKAT